MQAFPEHPSSLDGSSGELISAGGFRVLRPPDVQRLGIVFPIMARMPGNRDWIDLFGSRVHCNEEACG